MEDKATLYLMVGLPGAGKTTKAKLIERETGAVRFTPDEIIINRHGGSLGPEKHDLVRSKIEDEIWEEAQKLLKSRQNVVLDFGFWEKKERDKKREQAEKVGALTKIIFLDAPVDELWRRSSSRPETKKVGTLHFTRKDLDNWSKIFEPPTKQELDN